MQQNSINVFAMNKSTVYIALFSNTCRAIKAAGNLIIPEIMVTA